MRFFIKSLHVVPAVFSGAVLLLSAGSSHADELMDALKMKMQYLSQSQAVISKNLANSNTPGYKAMELKEPDYHKVIKGATLTTTSPMHISGLGGANHFMAVKQKDTYETAPNGNNVSIEEQMIKLSANGSEHQVATNLMRSMTSMVDLATGER